MTDRKLQAPPLGGPIHWNDDEDPRDVSSTFKGLHLRVKAIKHGTEWVATVKGIVEGTAKTVDYTSPHVSKDAGKQRAAKVAREQVLEAATPAEQAPAAA